MLKIETQKLIIFYYIAVNVISFAAYGADKAFAKAGSWRIPEAVLIFFAVMGGGIGALLAMLVFHHKTRKPKFVFLVPFAILAHAGGWLYLFEHGGIL